MPRIICAGLIAVDLVFEVAQYPAAGTKNRASTAHLIPGGGAMNAASAIAGLGADVCLAGAVGRDEFGTFLRKKMDERQIDSTHVLVLPGVRTPSSTVLLTPNGDRTIINHRDQAFSAFDINLPEPFGFDAALVDTRWPDGALRILEAAQRAGKPGVVDAEAPVKIASEALGLATHIIFSEQGLTDYIGACDALALKAAALRLGTWCAVTRGASSVLCHDGRMKIEAPAVPANVQNTLGAGDVWHGAFTLALARGRREIDAVKWANAAASLKVSRPVRSEHFPTAAETDAVKR
ncbi:PfkB family carbohydrate kinase [uncultured Roseobacter sp.]|uniref:carbohydrate kinase family protein n=1 Tax=uncultured Roseobacter sp. TaxID=114847 RepID=UPI00261D67E0|nr:PfkB family carbohydrate kinase [uncultured Roseobacter sp.]